jgi:hypothetical protein
MISRPREASRVLVKGSHGVLLRQVAAVPKTGVPPESNSKLIGSEALVLARVLLGRVLRVQS